MSEKLEDIYCGYCGGHHIGNYQGVACHDHYKKRAEKAEAELAELKEFVRVVTLCLQKNCYHNLTQMEPMFQRAYRLHSKYDVEGKG